MQRHTLIIDHPFPLETGGQLPRLELVYHTSPRAYRPGDRVIWICHALTASSDAEDWWPGLVGPGKYFDTERDFVVCVNILTDKAVVLDARVRNYGVFVAFVRVFKANRSFHGHRGKSAV